MDETAAACRFSSVRKSASAAFASMRERGVAAARRRMRDARREAIVLRQNLWSLLWGPVAPVGGRGYWK